MKYLKSDQYYEDQYDRRTVEICRSLLSEEVDIEKYRKEAEGKGIEESEMIRALVVTKNLHIYFTKGDRYVHREETIKRWMRSDEARDRLLEEAEPPEDISCHTCGRLMFVSSKHLNIGMNDDDTVLFFYDCPLNHLPRRAFYNTGEEFQHKTPTCPKCHSELKEVRQRETEMIVIKQTCSSCDYTNIEDFDFGTKLEEVEDLHFTKDRQEFCLSEKDGQEYIRSTEQIMRMGNLFDEIKEKEKSKDLYDAVAKLKKFKIVELEEYLAQLLEKAGYIKLQFKEPDVTKDVFLPFIVYEQKQDREGRASTYELECLLRKALKETNWRLVSGGVNYRLGMLEGRLHGYDREEDLIKLVRKKNHG